MISVRYYYYSPFLLSLAATIATWISTIPSIWSVSFSRWYRWVTWFAWALLAGTVILVIGISSPFLALAIVLVGIFVVLTLGSKGAEAKIGSEALNYLHSLVSIMASDQGLVEALRDSSQSPDFLQVYPRMTNYAREIIAQVDSGATGLSQAIADTIRGIPTAGAHVWTRIGTLARVIEEEHGMLSPNAQRETLDTFWMVLHKVGSLGFRMGGPYIRVLWLSELAIALKVKVEALE